MKIYAVVTGDIKNFTKLGDQQRGKLVIETELLLRTMVASTKDAQVFRGDSYQFITKDIGDVLKKSIQLICWFKLNTPENSQQPLGTRLSIGIGEISYEGKSVLDSDGEAFHLSGRNFDEMDKDEIIRLTTFDKERTELYETILMLLNPIINKWTKSQAETIFHLLKRGGTQGDIARDLNAKQPTIAKSLRAARWKEVEKGINYINRELKKQYLI